MHASFDAILVARGRSAAHTGARPGDPECVTIENERRSAAARPVMCAACGRQLLPQAYTRSSGAGHKGRRRPHLSPANPGSCGRRPGVSLGHSPGQSALAISSNKVVRHGDPGSCDLISAAGPPVAPSATASPTSRTASMPWGAPCASRRPSGRAPRCALPFPSPRRAVRRPSTVATPAGEHLGHRRGCDGNKLAR